MEKGKIATKSTGIPTIILAKDNYRYDRGQQSPKNDLKLKIIEDFFNFFFFFTFFDGDQRNSDGACTQVLVSFSPIVLFKGIEPIPDYGHFGPMGLLLVWGSPLKILVEGKRYIANNREYGKYAQ